MSRIVPRNGAGTGCVLVLLAAICHAEVPSREPVKPGVFYVSVVSDDAGVPKWREAAVAVADSECGWEDPPAGATVGCVPPVVEGTRQRIVVHHVDAEGEPVAAETNLEFRYSTMPISATADVDYPSAEGTMTIKVGELVSSPATFATIDDTLDEFQEAFAVKLDPQSPVDLEFDYVVIPINDNDPEVRVSLAGADISEDGGVLAFAISLRGESGKRISVDYATSDGTAVADADYRAVAGTLTFEPGDLAKTVEVSVIDDNVHEPLEWFELRLTNAHNARLPRAPARGTIRDDDVVLSIAGANSAEPSGTLDFAVTATGLTTASRTVTVDYATQDGTATADADYEPVSGTLTFTGDQATQIVSVPLIDDETDEPDETLSVLLTNAVNAMIGTPDAVGVIEDDDPLPELRINGGSAMEGEPVRFVVELSGSTARTVTVNYATEDGTATAGSDYRSESGTLTVAPGVSTATLVVDTIEDEAYELDETFRARLSSPVNATIVTGQASGTIIDDDEEPAAVTVRPADPMLCVGGAPATIDLSRHFSGDNLSYTVSDPDPSVATASLDGVVLTLTPVAEGTTTVTVTAANMGSQAAFELTITVAADPAEIAAIKHGLAVAGGVMLADVMDAIGRRFADTGASAHRSGEPPTASGVPLDPSAAYVLPHWTEDPGGFPAREVWPPLRSPDRTRLAPVSSAFSAASSSGMNSWSAWGRGGVRRFGDGEQIRDGSLTAVQVGADTRFGDWVFGAAGALGRTDADYVFLRSTDACGGGGEGEGVLETEIASVHPYLGRRVGRGWLWGTIGTGSGEAVVKRCTSGRHTSADLSMRMGAVGGRHLIRGGEKVEVSLVEDFGVLDESVHGPSEQS